MTYVPIIGMEIHVELATQSKMFCGCKNDPFYAPKPNIYTCPTCLGLPGALPVPNKKAIDWTMKLGLSLGCTIAASSKFDRKNYFYPDLAKGYQISQYDEPFCVNGIVHIPEGDVRIHRVHLEEDTGKLIHDTVEGKKMTLVDFNRSGVPLVEIVTEPDVRSGEHAKAFLKKLHQIIRYVDISGADMEKGSMRLEPNISLKETSSRQLSAIRQGDLPKYKVEVKNINSFNFVKRAIDYEITRQTELLDRGETPIQETRGYVESTSTTISQRTKESADDYRYFPEPDIPPFAFSKKDIDVIRMTLPELPDEKSNRFIRDYRIPSDSAEKLSETKDRADLFEDCMNLKEGNDMYSMITPVAIVHAILNRKQDGSTVSPQELLTELKNKTDNNAVDPAVIEHACRQIITQHLPQVEEYRKGKTGIIMFLIGQVKRELKGRGDAKTIESILKEQLQ